MELQTAIRAGSVDRATIAMTATYDAVVDLGVRSGDLRVTSTIIARNDDPEPIDRIELNTSAAPLAAMKLGAVSVDGAAVTASVDSQTILVPLGGVL
ncbi:MAG: hypothetical protein L0221_08995, partial [Chloroflexi bacterium]|nr:hypothetical protein [Chloroflexota bacterium]